MFMNYIFSPECLGMVILFYPLCLLSIFYANVFGRMWEIPQEKYQYLYPCFPFAGGQLTVVFGMGGIEYKIFDIVFFVSLVCYLLFCLRCKREEKLLKKFVPVSYGFFVFWLLICLVGGAISPKHGIEIERILYGIGALIVNRIFFYLLLRYVVCRDIKNATFDLIRNWICNIGFLLVVFITLFSVWWVGSCYPELFFTPNIYLFYSYVWMFPIVLWLFKGKKLD